MTEPSFPAVPQPPMRRGHQGEYVDASSQVTAVIDNRTGLPDGQVQAAVMDRWTEFAGLQFATPSNFQLYTTNQGSMLARTPFRTPQSVIDEIRLARSVADTDDDVGAIIGEMNAIAFGDGVVNQHRDEKTLEFFNQIAAPTALDLETVCEEMYREFLIAASVTTVTIFGRKRMQYWPLKSEVPVQAQLQVPNVGILPAENVRIITNDLMRQGTIAYHVEDDNLRRWLNEYLDPNTNEGRRAYMAMTEPIMAALFTGKVTIPYTDGDPASRGQTLYTMNPRMVHRSTAPKGATPYPRPFLTRNFALLEAKRLLNIMDYCQDLSAEILTRSGWKRHDEVQVGDETVGYNPHSGRSEWTTVTRVHHLDDVPFVRLGNSNWGARVSPAHRWWADKRIDHGSAGRARVGGFVRTEDINGSHRLLLAARLKAKTGPRAGRRAITEPHARLVAWVLADGWIQASSSDRNSNPKFEVVIAQKKKRQIASIERLLRALAVPYSVYVDRNGVHRFRLDPRVARKLWRGAGLPLVEKRDLPEGTLVEWVLGLTAVARKGFLEAAFQAEGWRDRRGHKLVAQNDGQLLEALALATYLEGYLPRLARASQSEDCWVLRRGRSRVNGASLTKEPDGHGPAWCVETELGTWTMRQGRGICLTGNSLLQGGTNYIVVATKGTDDLPAQQQEVDNLMEQVRHASRSGVMVGDHRVKIEIITPKLDELLNPKKRMLIGRKIKMGLMRQTEEVASDTGTQGATNEMELTARVIAADRRKLVRHAQATFYDETATRNRAVFPMGAPSIWAPKIILSNVAQFWQNLLQARDRGDIPRRWVVEALGYDYDAALAERERELARGDDEILMPGAVPFSNPGDPQDNNSGRPPGASHNNGRSQDQPQPAQVRPRRVIQRNAGETVTAMVHDGEVHYIGEMTKALLEEYAAADYNGYVTQVERDAIDFNQALRSASSVVIPVNAHVRCDELACVKLEEGLRVIVGRRIGDGAMFARALRFGEPQWDLKRACETALRWGFLAHPVVEDARRRSQGPTCSNCGAPLEDFPQNPVCSECGTDNTVATGGSGAGGMGGPGESALAEAIKLLTESNDATVARLLDEIAKGRSTTPPPREQSDPVDT